jgi:hypothetical protein
MPDYGTFCPIAMGADVVADRWTPLILRELLLGNTRFNDIARGLQASRDRCSSSASSTSNAKVCWSGGRAPAAAAASTA